MLKLYSYLLGTHSTLNSLRNNLYLSDTLIQRISKLIGCFLMFENLYTFFISILWLNFHNEILIVNA